MAMVLLTCSTALACPYCVGRDKDEVASTLVIVAMVSVPFMIVAVTGWIIRRANTDVESVHERAMRTKTSEVC